jgi:hypothetical protein
MEPTQVDAITVLLTTISRFMESTTKILCSIHDRINQLEHSEREVRSLWVLCEEFQKRLHVLEDGANSADT